MLHCRNAVSKSLLLGGVRRRPAEADGGRQAGDGQPKGLTPERSGVGGGTRCPRSGRQAATTTERRKAEAGRTDEGRSRRSKVCRSQVECGAAGAARWGGGGNQDRLRLFTGKAVTWGNYAEIAMTAGDGRSKRLHTSRPGDRGGGPLRAARAYRFFSPIAGCGGCGSDPRRSRPAYQRR